MNGTVLSLFCAVATVGCTVRMLITFVGVDTAAMTLSARPVITKGCCSVPRSNTGREPTRTRDLADGLTACPVVSCPVSYRSAPNARQGFPKRGTTGPQAAVCPAVASFRPGLAVPRRGFLDGSRDPTGKGGKNDPNGPIPC